MGTLVKRTSSKGEITYTARVRKRGFPPLNASFSRRTDAKAWMNQEETKIQQGLHFDYVEAKKHTLHEAIDRFIREEKAHPNRVKHLNVWKEALGPLVLSAITEIRINDVTSGWLRKEGDAPSFGPATVNRYLNSLSVIFVAAKEWGWVTPNPIRDAKKYREPKGRVRFLSDDERTTLLKACKESDYRPLHLIVVLALSTGMRKEELLGLKWQQVDLVAGALALTKTKNGDSRRVAVRGLGLELLKEYAKVRRLGTEYLFPGEKPPPQKPCKAVAALERHFDIRKPWQRAVKEAKLIDFCFHDLRHSCASYLAMDGATLLEIAEVLGHKSLEVVKRYAHFAESHTAAVVERMNRKVFGSGGG